MKVTLENLKAACRAHDNAIDIGISFAEVLSRRGVEAEDAVYVAEQRALRVILGLRHAPQPELFATVHLTEKEQAMLHLLAGVWIDGCIVGLKVTE